ncbi:MAG: hypothetical protein WBA12_03485 [Catalinimonas sp.]
MKERAARPFVRETTRARTDDARTISLVFSTCSVGTSASPSIIRSSVWVAGLPTSQAG